MTSLAKLGYFLLVSLSHTMPPPTQGGPQQASLAAQNSALPLTSQNVAVPLSAGTCCFLGKSLMNLLTPNSHPEVQIVCSLKSCLLTPPHHHHPYYFLLPSQWRSSLKTSLPRKCQKMNDNISHPHFYFFKSTYNLRSEKDQRVTCVNWYNPGKENRHFS